MSIRQGSNIIAGGGGGSVDIDNISITENLSQEIQTVGVIDQNNISNAIKTWTGTKAQYDAIVTKDPNTLYNITDDTDVTLTIIEALYPVGSIYITTANTCPLATLISGSTWTLRGSGIITNVSVSSSVPVKGNGKTLGLTNGTNDFGLNNGSSGGAFGYTSNFDVNVGTARSGTALATNGAFGVTTNASKSGIIADLSSAITSTSLSVNIFERVL